MKPVYQTKFGYREGNCKEACLASILELDIDQIDYDWSKSFFREKGYEMKLYSRFRNEGMEVLRNNPDKFFIVGFLKKKENYNDKFNSIFNILTRDDVIGHAVVFKGDKFVFDPNKKEVFLEEYLSDNLELVVSLERI